MRRVTKILLCLALCCLLPLTALAASSVTRLQSISSVTSEGICTVSLSLTIHMDSAVDGLVFPLPENAANITVNGTAARTRKGDGVRNVDISSLVPGAGDYPMSISYTLSGVVEAAEDDTVLLTLPLLSGFAYPITNMEFTVTLPGNVTQRPSFSSSYYRESIESDMSFTYNSATVSGIVNAALKDHESLTMTLELPAEMFPSVKPQTNLPPVSHILTYVCIGLALLYWLLTMRCMPVIAPRRAMPPDGLTAGDVGSHLTGVGTDLSLMVVTWAQLGYILLQIDDNGRVLLHKRMDMGNERSAFENRCFRSLFGRKRMIDGSGYHYARLCRKVAGSTVKNGVFRRNSGNPKLFRTLSAGIALFAGAAIAGGFTASAVLGSALAVILGAFGAVSAYFIQNAFLRCHLRRHGEMRLAAIVSALWLILGIWAELSFMGLLLVASQILAGLAAGYGGRRTDGGKQTTQQLLGLRRYLTAVPRDELKQLQRRDPDYFYKMAPYALALGVDRQFARQFGNMDLPECPFLVTRMGSDMTATEWAGLLRDAVETLDERQRQLTTEKFLGR